MKDDKKTELRKAFKSFGVGLFKGFAFGIAHYGETIVKNFTGEPQAYIQQSVSIYLGIFIVRYSTFYSMHEQNDNE